MKAWSLLVVSLVLFGAAPQRCWAGEDPAPTADSLGITETDEAALMITGGAALQRATLGSTAVDLTASPLIVRGLAEGLLPLQLQSEQRLWEGSVRLYAGRLTSFDAAVALASSESQDRQTEAFDLFDFYDRMDLLSSVASKLAWCQTILLNPPGPPDDALVGDLCHRLQRQADLVAERAAEPAGHPEDTVHEDMLDVPEEEAERRFTELRKLYRSDGRLRKQAPGSLFRWGIAALGFSGTAVASGAALSFEIQAERQYLLYRTAERVGDDPAMTRSLFVTQDLDRRRNAAIGLAAASLTTGIVAALFQRLEAKRFARYRASILAGEEGQNE